MAKSHRWTLVKAIARPTTQWSLVTNPPRPLRPSLQLYVSIHIPCQQSQPKLNRLQRANAAAHKGVEGAVEKADGRKMTRHVAFRPQHESPAAPEAAPARVPALEYRVYFRETRVECVYGAPNTNEFGSN